MRPTVPRFDVAAAAVLLALLQTAGAGIPLQAGLRVVTALSDREGDYESIKTVDAVDGAGVTISYAADIPSGQRGVPPRQVHTKRIVRRQDLETAHEYMQVFNPSAPPTIAGTTAIGASAAVLTELKTKGQTTFTFQTPGRPPSMDRVMAALTGKAETKGGSLDDLAKRLDASKASGTLARVEAGDVPFPVLVNGVRTTVNAIHARGTFDDLHVEFYFLDDPANPLALKWTTGTTTGTLQVVQITYVAAQSAAPIESALKESGRAEVHGIYFDFGSATIKPESDAVLKDIAEALAKNPAWKLSVEGHTDNVGGDAANLELSKRRADAVKQALIANYRVDGARLSTTGFGASRPKETNDSAEGRARNRRVELVRQ
jgi:outer membrane protein OmpA-like peptidoglycan-associated protein